MALRIIISQQAASKPCGIFGREEAAALCLSPHFSFFLFLLHLFLEIAFARRTSKLSMCDCDGDSLPANRRKAWLPMLARAVGRVEEALTWVWLVEMNEPQGPSIPTCLLMPWRVMYYGIASAAPGTVQKCAPPDCRWPGGVDVIVDRGIIICALAELENSTMRRAAARTETCLAAI